MIRHEVGNKFPFCRVEWFRTGRRQLVSYGRSLLSVNPPQYFLVVPFIAVENNADKIRQRKHASFEPIFSSEHGKNPHPCGLTHIHDTSKLKKTEVFTKCRKINTSENSQLVSGYFSDRLTPDRIPWIGIVEILEPLKKKRRGK